MVFCPQKARSVMQRGAGYSVRRDGCRVVLRVSGPCRGFAWEPDGLGRWVSWNPRENRVLQEEKGRRFGVTGDGTVVLISFSHCCGSSLTAAVAVADPEQFKGQACYPAQQLSVLRVPSLNSECSGSMEV